MLSLIKVLLCTKNQINQVSQNLEKCPSSFEFIVRESKNISQKANERWKNSLSFVSHTKYSPYIFVNRIKKTISVFRCFTLSISLPFRFVPLEAKEIPLLCPSSHWLLFTWRSSREQQVSWNRFSLIRVAVLWPETRISWHSPLKGSVLRDFRPPVFFMLRTHLGPW